jgi:arylsulfatase A-like enzyme
LVEHAGVLALRRGPWKYIEPGKGAKRLAQTNTETGQDPAGQLFNLATDLGERSNLNSARPELAGELARELERVRAAGRVR